MIRGSKEYWTVFMLMLIAYSIYHGIVFLIKERKKAKNRAYNKQQEELEKRQVVEKEEGVVLDIEAEERKKNSIILQQVHGFWEIPYESAVTTRSSFHCAHCETPNEVLIPFLEPGDSQFGVARLVYQYEVLSRYDIYDWELAESRPDIPNSFYVGTNPAVGKILACSNCEEVYLMVFSAGEQQPSRYSTFINGVWQIRKTSELVD